MHRGDTAQTRADIDVSLRTQCLQLIFQARILPQRLNEGSHRIESGQVHLLFQIVKVAGRVALIDPRRVGLKIKLRLAD